MSYVVRLLWLCLADRSGVTDAVRAQFLAIEHWSLLATRTMI